MSSFDCIPDHPSSSDLVRRLKSALDVGDENTVMDLICTEVQHVNATIELSNDDWMKEPQAHLHPLVLVSWFPVKCGIQRKSHEAGAQRAAGEKKQCCQRSGRTAD
ncbi:hypothetical protein KIL84_012662 [Mauremys mutica]|uniref:Uncharacterized protein n=1 Tax=Mauremys mutica TaxID=74926 RepID=A0A9D3XRD7_9SAUR|nr:hypothetical protein KIL84_012662 [Mauremys mutica]